MWKYKSTINTNFVCFVQMFASCKLMFFLIQRKKSSKQIALNGIRDDCWMVMNGGVVAYFFYQLKPTKTLSEWENFLIWLIRWRIKQTPKIDTKLNGSKFMGDHAAGCFKLILSQLNSLKIVHILSVYLILIDEF